MKLTLALTVEQNDLFFLGRRYGKQRSAARVIKQAIAEIVSEEAAIYLKELENDTQPIQRVPNTQNPPMAQADLTL